MYIPRLSNARKMHAALAAGYTIHLRDVNDITLATIGTINGLMVITTIPTVGAPIGHLLLDGTRLAGCCGVTSACTASGKSSS